MTQPQEIQIGLATFRRRVLANGDILYDSKTFLFDLLGIDPSDYGRWYGGGLLYAFYIEADPWWDESQIRDALIERILVPYRKSIRDPETVT